MKIKGKNIRNKEDYCNATDKDGDKCSIVETIKVITSINFKNNWIIDSGCGYYLINNGIKFTHLRQYEGNDKIITVDNTTVHYVEKESTIIILDKDNDLITLKSVYHISSMKKNIFYIANIVDAKSYILFCPNEVKFVYNIKELNET
ncbi:unnamed protein product [Musa acuminata var. zebrina]